MEYAPGTLREAEHAPDRIGYALGLGLGSCETHPLLSVSQHIFLSSFHSNDLFFFPLCVPRTQYHTTAHVTSCRCMYPPHPILTLLLFFFCLFQFSFPTHVVLLFMCFLLHAIPKRRRARLLMNEDIRVIGSLNTLNLC